MLQEHLKMQQEQYDFMSQTSCETLLVIIEAQSRVHQQPKSSVTIANLNELRSLLGWHLSRTEMVSSANPDLTKKTIILYCAIYAKCTKYAWIFHCLSREQISFCSLYFRELHCLAILSKAGHLRVKHWGLFGFPNAHVPLLLSQPKPNKPLV